MHVILPFLLAITGTASAQASAEAPLNVQTQALEALVDGDVPQIERLVRRFPSLLSQEVYHQTLVRWACDSKVSDRCFASLLKAGASIPPADEDPSVAQHLAWDVRLPWPFPVAAISQFQAETNQIEKFRFLGGSRQAPTNRGPSPFARAVQSEWYRVADYIYALGIDPAAPENAEAIVRAPNARALKYALGKGLAADMKDRQGDTALFHIADLGRSDSQSIAIAKLLISKGCSLEAPNARGETPLSHLVQMVGTYKIWHRLVEFLASYPAAIRARDRWGRTPLFYAQYDDNSAKVLIEAGSDVNAKDNEGFPVLHAMIFGLSGTGFGFTGEPRADWRYRRDAVRLMIQRGANINWRDKKTGGTLLDTALHQELPDEVSDLRRWGAKTDFELDTGQLK